MSKNGDEGLGISHTGEDAWDQSWQWFISSTKSVGSIGKRLACCGCLKLLPRSLWPWLQVPISDARKIGLRQSTLYNCESCRMDSPYRHTHTNSLYIYRLPETVLYPRTRRKFLTLRIYILLFSPVWKPPASSSSSTLLHSILKVHSHSTGICHS